MRKLTHLLLTLLTINGAASSQDLNWRDIPPNRNLVYHDCYDEFKCARLILPLNWLDNKSNHTVIIPIIKLPAAVAETDPTFGGALITNPGGPGEPGTEFVVDFGHRLRSVADKPGKRHYEIISFDPRGVGNSEPAANCFPDNTLDRIVSTFETRANGASFQGLETIPYGLALQDVYGKRCKEADDRLAGGIFEYMSTASVARDIVELVDKIEEARVRDQPASGEDSMHTELRKREAKDVNRVQYWGFSYGTVLGNVLASMFPERIGRIVLDGVVDAEDFVAGRGYALSLVDTDKIVDSFIKGCFKAGSSKCRMVQQTDASASDIKSRFSKWFNNLEQSPKIVTVQRTTFIITRAEVGRAILYSLYKPIQTFKDLASVLEDGMSGNYTSLATKMLEMNIIAKPADGCPKDNQPIQGSSGLDSRNGVVCGDGSDVSQKPITWWHSYFKDLLDLSPIAAPYWSTIRFTCARWPFKPNWTFKGPFGTPEYDPKATPGKPAAPILFVSNRLDPVTPLAGARKMVKRYPGAGLVIQENLGHCALVNGESACLNKHIADYFETGKVPKEEVSCHVRCGPWDTGCNVEGVELKNRHSILGV